MDGASQGNPRFFFSDCSPWTLSSTGFCDQIGAIPMSVPAGFQLGPYKILSPLGKGGMGEVYKALDTRLGRPVAIKVLPEQLATSTDALKRFEREAKALAALNHPNILAIYDVGIDQGISFAVMELLEGKTLRARIDHSALPWQHAWRFSASIAEGLSAAHSKGVIHRDLKPENIFLTSDDRVKILDFGLAQLVGVARSEEGSVAQTASIFETQSGSVMGTVPYMSPEQVRGSKVDERTDIFSFGCVLHEMLSGTRPFSRNSSAETIAAILKDDPPNLSQSGKEVPVELERISLHCLEKNPDHRFQSARDLVFALKSAPQAPGISQTRAAARPAFGRFRIVLAAAFAILIASLVFFYARRPGQKTIQSIAVLPFVNGSGDQNMEYLSDGITDGLINSLSQLPNLTVMSRNAVFRYKGPHTDAQVAGHELKVQAVLTGRVIQRGNELSIITELVDVQNNSHLWGDQYDETVADLISVQSEISQRIVENLRVKVSGEEQKRLTKHDTENTEAYQLYLKGMYHWNKLNEDEVLKAIPFFEEAIRQDRSYALAYGGLAGCYVVLGINYRRPSEMFPKARINTIKAVELVDTLVPPHLSLALVKMFNDWDWPGSERELKRARQLDPKNGDAYDLYGVYLQAMNRPEEAVAITKKGLELNPLSLVMNADLGSAFYLARRYDEATRQFQATFELDPGYGIAHSWLASVYAQKKMFAEAIQEAKKGRELEESSEELGRLGNIYALAGKKEEAEAVLAQLIELSKRKYIHPTAMAYICAGLGQKDKAFAWLEKAFQDRSPALIWIRLEPISDPLRSDPRFGDLMRRMGLAN
jgi:TolB-like protein